MDKSLVFVIFGLAFCVVGIVIAAMTPGDYLTLPYVVVNMFSTLCSGIGLGLKLNRD